MTVYYISLIIADLQTETHSLQQAIENAIEDASDINLRPNWVIETALIGADDIPDSSETDEEGDDPEGPVSFHGVFANLVGVAQNLFTFNVRILARVIADTPEAASAAAIAAYKAGADLN